MSEEQHTIIRSRQDVEEVVGRLTLDELRESLVNLGILILETAGVKLDDDKPKPAE